MNKSIYLVCRVSGNEDLSYFVVSVYENEKDADDARDGLIKDDAYHSYFIYEKILH